MRGCPGDPALPAPLSSRVSLLQCSDFSINSNNCNKAATFAFCTRAANCTAAAFETRRYCTSRRTRSFSTEFPSIPPFIQDYSNINSYFACKERQIARYAIAFTLLSKQLRHVFVESRPRRTLTVLKLCVSVVCFECQRLKLAVRQNIVDSWLAKQASQLG